MFMFKCYQSDFENMNKYDVQEIIGEGYQKFINHLIN